MYFICHNRAWDKLYDDIELSNTGDTYVEGESISECIKTFIEDTTEYLDEVDSYDRQIYSAVLWNVKNDLYTIIRTAPDRFTCVVDSIYLDLEKYQ